MGLFSSIKSYALGDEVKAFDTIKASKGKITLTVREKDGARRATVSAKSQSDTVMVVLDAAEFKAFAAQVEEAAGMM